MQIGLFMRNEQLISVLPEAARQQILHGQLPTLEPNNLFLKNGETCHYADRAIYEKRTVNKRLA